MTSLASERIGPGHAAEHLGRVGLAEQLGLWGGRVLAPLTGTVSEARRARMFHPDGVVYRARVTASATDADLSSLASRLGGAALLRFSSALWRAPHEWPDVLGVGLRFLADERAGEEQDVLLATIRFPWTMPFAPLATNFRSFLWNHYHAVAPFEVDGIGRVKLRLRSPRLHNGSGLSRLQHLQQVVSEQRACFTLQLRSLSPLPWARSWSDVAKVTLEAAVEVDQAALKFSPFRTGRGIKPVGFVHALRASAYAASQDSRPAHESSRPE